MEDLLRQQLTTSVLRCVGRSSGGYTCTGWSYETDRGRVFVKHNGDARVSTKSKGTAIFLFSLGTKFLVPA